MSSLSTVKIDHPLAKYTNTGLLQCILCKSNVKGAKFWTAHINGRQHRENAVSLKARKNKQEETVKRPPPPTHKPPESKRQKLSEVGNKGNTSEEVDPSTSSELPEDFFDHQEEDARPWEKEIHERKALEAEKTPKPNTAQALPQGFFDDPNRDAKVRKVEAKDRLDAEWQRFQKELQQTEQVSEALMEEDEEQTKEERTIEEIDEQIEEWNRVKELQDRKEELGPLVKPKSVEEAEFGDQEDESMSEDDDFQAQFDWRSKTL